MAINFPMVDNDGNIISNTPQMIQRTVRYTDTGVSISIAYKGDTTNSVYACWTDMLHGTNNAVNGIYLPAPSDQTLYGIAISNADLTSTPASGSAIGIYTTPDFQSGTRIWYEAFYPQSTGAPETNPYQMISRSIQYTEFNAVNAMYVFKGDTSQTLNFFWSDYVSNGYTKSDGMYVANTDVTLYMATASDATNAKAHGVTYTFTTSDDPTVQTGMVWNEVYQVPALDGGITQDQLDTKADKYYLGRQELTTLSVGDAVGGMFINFDIPDFVFSEDADGGYATYDAITFSDGSRIRFENSSWYYMDAQEGISLPTIIHTIVEGGNYWTDSSWTIPAGLTITAIDPRWYDSPMSKGHIQTSASNTETITVDCEYNYNALTLFKETEARLLSNLNHSEYNLLLADAKLQGLMEDTDNLVSLAEDVKNMTVNDQNGGIFQVVFRNTVDKPTCIGTINDTNYLDSTGIAMGATISKSFRLKLGDVVSTSNAVSVMYMPLIDDPNSLQNQFAELLANFTTHVSNDAMLYNNIYNSAQGNTDGITIIGNSGLLTVGGGGQYVVPAGGKITITFSAVLGLGNAEVFVNGGDPVFDSGAVNLLALPAPKDVFVNSGDIITTSGSLGLLASLAVVYYQLE